MIWNCSKLVKSGAIELIDRRAEYAHSVVNWVFNMEIQNLADAEIMLDLLKEVDPDNLQFDMSKGYSERWQEVYDSTQRFIKAVK